MRKPSERQGTVALITEAEPSQSDQLQSRQRRYLIMMGSRVVCLILAAVAYSLHAAWLVPICIVGMVTLPWMAVLIANDRPPLKPSRLRRVTEPAPTAPAVEAPTPHRIIDHQAGHRTS